MIDLLLLAIPFKENFVTDVLMPGGALVFVAVLILNSLLGHFGYKLW